MTEIGGDADHAHDRIDAPVEKYPEADERDIEGAVDGAVPLGAVTIGGDAAPEGEDAENMQPKGKVRWAFADHVDRPGNSDHGSAKPDGDALANVKVVI